VTIKIHWWNPNCAGLRSHSDSHSHADGNSYGTHPEMIECQVKHQHTKFGIFILNILFLVNFILSMSNCEAMKQQYHINGCYLLTHQQAKMPTWCHDWCNKKCNLLIINKWKLTSLTIVMCAENYIMTSNLVNRFWKCTCYLLSQEQPHSSSVILSLANITNMLHYLVCMVTVLLLNFCHCKSNTTAYLITVNPNWQH